MTYAESVASPSRRWLLGTSSWLIALIFLFSTVATAGHVAP